MVHEHASLAQVQQYSGIPAGTPLFTALLNYRHFDVSLNPGGQDCDLLEVEERTNYP